MNTIVTLPIVMLFPFLKKQKTKEDNNPKGKSFTNKYIHELAFNIPLGHQGFLIQLIQDCFSLLQYICSYNRFFFITVGI